MGLEFLPPPTTLKKTEWPPKYLDVWEWRIRQITALRKDPQLLADAKAYYSLNPIDFINGYVDTYDPRYALSETMPTVLPMVMFERQQEFVEFIYACLNTQVNGAVDKSRTMGATWLSCAVSVCLWLFVPGAAVGWGSRKENLVDLLGDPKCIFDKLRRIINRLPSVFLPLGFDPMKHMSFMKIINPENGATIAGEGGDNIGRGGRTTIYFKDESAHYVHAEAIEAALGENTRCQIDISTHNGVGTVFDRKLQAGKIWVPGAEMVKGETQVFILDWRDHPEMTQEWHDTREKEYGANGLLHVFRQEVDRDPAASLSGIIIKPEWVRAAIDAHIELKFGELGGWSAGLDPFDEGGDLHALTFRKGVVLHYAECWGDGDVGDCTRRAILETVGKRPVTIQYDCIGIGAGVKSEANRLAKDNKLPRDVTFAPWDAGNGPVGPDRRLIPGDSQSPLVKDFYGNLKAQGWWELARRFEKVYRMRKEGIRFPVAELISISSRILKKEQLIRELSQAVMIKSSDLRLIVDKKPDGAKSPNMADATVMNFFPVRGPMVISAEAVRTSAR